MLAHVISAKGALVIVTLIGMAMCTAGIGRVAARGAWLQPMSMLAYLIGALILVVVGATLLGIRLPYLPSPRAAIVAVLVLAAVKILITRLHAL